MFSEVNWPQMIEALQDTLYMTFASLVLSVIFGIVIGIILYVTQEDGIYENKLLYRILDLVVNVLRAIPFIILLIILIPFTKMIVGSIRMWLTEAISAVNVMIKVDVPTAVFRSYPSIAVNTISIIMPPPVPKKPVPKPMVSPKNKDTAISFAVSFTLPSFSGRSLESGLTRKRMPIATQRRSENPPSTF